MNALDHNCHRSASLITITNKLRQPLKSILQTKLEETYVIGTSYDQTTLPFSKKHIRSEILYHKLNTHIMYPQTSTVLNISDQNTKAIQVDSNNIVESFQMNNHCTTKCGHYLDYITNKMNLGLHELDPITMQSTRKVRINSTCTIFANAELHDRLSINKKHENIVQKLHHAIILHAMSILSRSNSVNDQFTFTSSVAKNKATVEVLKKLIFENYNELTMNIDPDSIYTNALKTTTFAQRVVEH